MADVLYNFFGTASPFLSHPLLTAERTAREVDAILDLGPAPRRVADIGCGFGRHVVEFARRGFDVIGVDPSDAMCAAARQRIAEAGLNPTIEQETLVGFAKRVERRDVEPFDLALMLFTTFGQLGADEASPAHEASALAALLRTGGTAIIEVPERDRTIAALVEHEQLGPTTVTRNVDTEASTMHERFDGPGASFDLGYRLFRRDELAQLMTDAGLSVIEVLDTALAPPPPTLMTLIVRRDDRL